MRTLWRHYRFELTLGLIVATGLVALLGPWDIPEFLRHQSRAGYELVVRWTDSLLSFAADVMGSLGSLSLFEAVGSVLVTTFALVLIWRIRWRVLTNSRLTATTCPRCGTDLKRIHRKTLDRVLNYVVPVRRYLCANTKCTWRGLRVHGNTAAPFLPEAPQPPATSSSRPSRSRRISQ